MHLGTEIFAFWRQSMDRRQSIFCIYNVTNVVQSVNLADINLVDVEAWRDLISGQVYENPRGTMTLDPYQAIWLSNR